MKLSKNDIDMLKKSQDNIDKIMQGIFDIKEDNKEEKVNHPSHYNFTKMETLDIIDNFSTHEEYVGFLKGNVIKYLHRYSHKNGMEDLRKASWYLNKLIEVEGGNLNV